MEEKFDRALAAKFRELSEEKGPEPYEIGAWEAFQSVKNGRKSNPLRFLWIGLAASFLMAMSVNTIYNTTNQDFRNSGIAFSTYESDNARGRLDIVESNSDFILNTDGKLQYKASYKPSSIDLDYVVAKELKVTKSLFASVSKVNELKGLNENSVPNNINSPKTDRQTKEERLFKVGFLVSSSGNVIKRKVGGFNYGGGIMAEVPISRKVSLNTGGIINSQIFNYSTGTAEKPNKIVTKGKAVSIDVPVNLTYRFAKRKKKEMFVSAGISSISYFKENFKDRVITDETFCGDPSYTNKISGFDFAKFINVSFGFEVPLEKQLSLLIEPYLKYPIGGSTSRDIELASAGLNLKLNMGLAKLY